MKMKSLLRGLILATLMVTFTAGMVSAGEVDVYHWWTAGGEEEAINAVVDAFEEAHPDISIVQNPVAGGGGGVMRAEVKSMIAAGNPPDSFMLTYGRGMLGSYAPVLEPLNHIWEDYPVPDEVKQWGTIADNQYAVPLNIHRTNALWYNTDIIEEVGVETPIVDLDGFMEALEEVKEAGYIPLAVGHGGEEAFWWNLVFESLLTAVPAGDYEVLESFYAGELNLLESEAFEEALQVMAEIINNDYINDDYSALTWDQAAGLVATGEAAFNIMGDWAKGYFLASDMEPNEDFGFMPVPGTANLFIGHGDSFVAPQGMLLEGVESWLEFLTTKEAQTIFNPIKGSTPPRTDAPVEGYYDEIGEEIIYDFRDEDVIKTQSMLAGPKEEHVDIFGTLFGEFAQHLDIETTLQDMQSEYEIIYF